jgi:hypothetical protein
MNCPNMMGTILSDVVSVMTGNNDRPPPPATLNEMIFDDTLGTNSSSAPSDLNTRCRDQMLRKTCVEQKFKCKSCAKEKCKREIGGGQQ